MDSKEQFEYPEVKGVGHDEHIEGSLSASTVLSRPARVFTPAEEKALYRKVVRTPKAAVDLRRADLRRLPSQDRHPHYADLGTLVPSFLYGEHPSQCLGTGSKLTTPRSGPG